MKWDGRVILLLFIFVNIIVLCRWPARYFEHKYSPSKVWIKERIYGSIQALKNEKNLNHRLTLFLGASEGEVGFSPKIYDNFNNNEGRNSYTLNMAVRNTGRFYPMYLKRIAWELKQNNIRPDLVMIQLPITRWTRTAQKSDFEVRRSINIQSIYFNTDFLWDSSISLKNKFFLGFDKYVMGESSLRYALKGPAVWYRTLLFDDFKSGLNLKTLWLDMSFYKRDPWDASTRGHFYWSWQGSLHTYKEAVYTLQQPKAFNSLKNRHISCCDFIDLNMDSNMIRQVVESIKEIKKYSKNTALILFPENPQVNRPEASQEKKYQVARSLSESTDTPLWVPGDSIRFSNRHFIDILHFSRSGFNQFSRQLALMTPQEWFKTESK